MTMRWISLCMLPLLCRHAIASDAKLDQTRPSDRVEKGTYKSAELTIVQQDGSTSSEQATYPAEVHLSSTLPLSGRLQASVEYSPTGTNLLLRLSCPKTSQALVLAVSSSKTTEVPVATIRSHFDSQCEDIVASFAPSTAKLEIGEWSLGTLRLPARGGEEAPSFYGAKPSIEHLFRVPGKRPPGVISLVFAALAALPLLGLLLGLYHSGVNFKGLPTTGFHGLSALVFHGGLVALVLLYAAFWVRLNLLQTLLPLLGLIVLLTGSGYCLLSQQSSQRLKQA